MNEVPEKFDRKRDTKWQKELRDGGVFAAEYEQDKWGVFGHKPWPIFRQDMSEYISELTDFFPKMEVELGTLFDSIRSKKKKVRAWDICGSADGDRIGVEETDCLTRILPGGDPHKRRQVEGASNHTQSIFEGDIFTKEALDPLIDRAHERGNPSVVFMIVRGGVRNSGQREHPGAGPMLLYQLKRVLENIQDGGHIYFQDPFYAHPKIKPKEVFTRLKKIVEPYGRLEPDKPGAFFYRVIAFDPRG